MRANTQTLRSAPNYSEFQSLQKTTWGKLSFSSVRAAHNYSLQVARTSNEDFVVDADRINREWFSLNPQTMADFDKTGVSTHALSLVHEAQAALPVHQTRPNRPAAAICGGHWDVPSVIAGLPLAARKRARTKLAPVTIKLAFFMSSGLSAERMAPLTAKLSRAIWDYVIAGGAVNLTVCHVGEVRSSPIKGLSIETRVNTSDVSALSLVLSPVFFRSVALPLMTAASDYRKDTIPCPQNNPISGALYIGGSIEKAITAAESVIKQLQIS